MRPDLKKPPLAVAFVFSARISLPDNRGAVYHDTVPGCPSRFPVSTIQSPNSVPSPFNRTLFTQMPPSIVITEPVPRWRVWALQLFKALVLLTLCAVSFYAGMRYQRQLPEGRALASPAAVAEAQPESPAQPQAAAQSATDLLAARSLDGLQVQSLRVVPDGAVPGQLLYEFELVNSGRLFEGTYEFLLMGVQDGRPQQWVFPAVDTPPPAAFRVRVANYVRITGKIQLPGGWQPQATVLSLSEKTGLRASRGLELGATPGAKAATGQ